MTMTSCFEIPPADLRFLTRLSRQRLFFLDALDFIDTPPRVIAVLSVVILLLIDTIPSSIILSMLVCGTPPLASTRWCGLCLPLERNADWKSSYDCWCRHAEFAVAFFYANVIFFIHNLYRFGMSIIVVAVVAIKAFVRSHWPERNMQLVHSIEGLSFGCLSPRNFYVN